MAEGDWWPAGDRSVPPVLTRLWPVRAQNRLTVLTSLTLDCYANPEAAQGSADVSFVPISGDELPPQIAPV